VTQGETKQVVGAADELAKTLAACFRKKHWHITMSEFAELHTKLRGYHAARGFAPPPVPGPRH
jgi:DNA-binding ferritin-like protein